MTKMTLQIFTILVVACCLHPKAQASLLCEEAFDPKKAPALQSLLNVDLIELQAEETLGLSKAQISAMNLESIHLLESTLPIPRTSRVTAVSQTTVEKLIASMTKNPVISASHRGVYDQKETDIGYCFGRAAYAHLALLKMGVDKDAIKKAWVVGEMRNGPTMSWQFHVATVVRGQDGKWYAIDDEMRGRAVNVGDWLKVYENENFKGDLRIYFSDAKKFTPELGTYDNLQLGLKMNRNEDWYKGFFKDLMVWLQTGTLDSVGLEKLSQSSATQPK